MKNNGSCGANWYKNKYPPVKDCIYRYNGVNVETWRQWWKGMKVNEKMNQRGMMKYNRDYNWKNKEIQLANKPVSKSCTVVKNRKIKKLWRATGQSNSAHKRLTATRASKVGFLYSYNCTLVNGAVFHSVCQVWLSSGPPEFVTFSYCAWLRNWLVKVAEQDCVYVCVCVCLNKVHTMNKAKQQLLRSFLRRTCPNIFLASSSFKVPHAIR